LTFLDLLLKASEENPNDLNDEVLRNEVCLFIAGVSEFKRFKYLIVNIYLTWKSILSKQSIDTTAVAMAWFLYLMAKCPEHQVYLLNQLECRF
jgi:cytochrome P450